MAKEVSNTFSASQLVSYGNIILNGYATVKPNTINKKAWQYAETTTSPVNLPSLTSFRPALKGWSTNYMEYYTELLPNAYGVEPGTPTMFEYNVHSFDLVSGAPAWAQPPRRFNQLQVSGSTPPQYVNNPTVIQYSYLYPVADNPVPPPIGSLN